MSFKNLLENPICLLGILSLFNNYVLTGHYPYYNYNTFKNLLYQTIISGFCIGYMLSYNYKNNKNKNNKNYVTIELSILGAFIFGLSYHYNRILCKYDYILNLF